MKTKMSMEFIWNLVVAFFFIVFAIGILITVCIFGEGKPLGIILLTLFSTTLLAGARQLIKDAWKEGLACGAKEMSDIIKNK